MNERALLRRHVYWNETLAWRKERERGGEMIIMYMITSFWCRCDTMSVTLYTHVICFRVLLLLVDGRDVLLKTLTRARRNINFYSVFVSCPSRIIYTVMSFLERERGFYRSKVSAINDSRHRNFRCNLQLSSVQFSSYTYIFFFKLLFCLLARLSNCPCYEFLGKYEFEMVV